MTTEQKRAVVLLSGGLDSSTVLGIATRRDGYTCAALSFRYGQRHTIELDRAAQIARHFGAQHRIIDINIGSFGGSALTDEQVPVPTDGTAGGVIPPTYVPGRNTVFIAVGLSLAEAIGAGRIYLGINAVDYSGYPDCRPEYLQAFEHLANLATRAGVEGGRMTIHAPLLHLSKAQIIERGLALGVDYAATISCYDPSPEGAACGACDACQLRLKGFAENGIEDPAPYLSMEDV